MFDSTLKGEIGVMVSVYNSVKYISDALDSLLCQSLNKEKYFVLVIDDGSIDGTPNILDSYKKTGNIALIKNNINRGLVFSINNALSLIDCKFIMRFDSDDIASPNLLSQLYNNIGEYAFCHPDMYIFSHGDIENKVSYKVSILPSFFASGVLFRYDVISRYKFSELFWEEFDLFLNILEAGYQYKLLPQRLLCHRIHKNNMTADRNKFIEGYRELEEKWGKGILEKYDFSLENLFRFYGYYLREA